MFFNVWQYKFNEAKCKAEGLESHKGLKFTLIVLCHINVLWVNVRGKVKGLNPIKTSKLPTIFSSLLITTSLVELMLIIISLSDRY